MPPADHPGHSRHSASGAIALDPDESGALALAEIPRAFDRSLPDLGNAQAGRRDEEERRLIARCVAGDVEAFRPLVQRYQRQVLGALFGACNPLYDVPRLLGLYRSGDLKLDELITRRYRLDDVDEAYRDLTDGKNIRGVIVHEH